MQQGHKELVPTKVCNLVHFHKGGWIITFDHCVLKCKSGFLFIRVQKKKKNTTRNRDIKDGRAAGFSSEMSGPLLHFRGGVSVGTNALMSSSFNRPVPRKTDNSGFRCFPAWMSGREAPTLKKRDDMKFQAGSEDYVC